MTEVEWEVLYQCGVLFRESVYRMDPRLALLYRGPSRPLIDLATAQTLRHALGELIQEYQAARRMAAAPVGETVSGHAPQAPQPAVDAATTQ